MYLCLHDNVDTILYFHKKLKRHLKKHPNSQLELLQNSIFNFPTFKSNDTSFASVINSVEIYGSHPLYDELSGPYKVESSTISLEFATEAATHVTYNSKQARHLVEYFDHYCTINEFISSSLALLLSRLTGLVDQIKFNSFICLFLSYYAKKDPQQLIQLKDMQCPPSMYPILMKLTQPKAKPMNMSKLYQLNPKSISLMTTDQQEKACQQITQLLLVQRPLATHKADQICKVIFWLMPTLYRHQAFQLCLKALYAPSVKFINGNNSFYREQIKPFAFHSILFILEFVKDDKYSCLEDSIIRLLDVYTQGHRNKRNALLEMLFEPIHKEKMKELLIKSKGLSTMEQ